MKKRAEANEASYLMMLEIKVNGVILDVYQVASLDSGRLNVPLAKWGYINKNNNSYDKIRYLYYVKDTIRYKLLEFLYNPHNSEEKWAFSHYKPLILFFESDAERIEFEEYVICKYSEFESKLGNCKQYDYITADNSKKTDMVIELLQTGIILNEMFGQYKINNTNID